MSRQNPKSQYDYDLFVIGGGSGGVRAARIAASYGAKVAIAEKYRLGGTCVIRGCVPKKLFVYASQLPISEKNAKAFGWNNEKLQHDMKTFYQNKEKYIGKLENIYQKMLEQAKVNIFYSHAKIKSANEIYLADDDKTVTAKFIIIAAGAKAVVPEIQGAEYAITSSEFLQLQHKPTAITIVGGGYIAVEFAGITNGLGIKTALVYRGQRVLKKFDSSICEHLTKAMQKKNIKLHLQTNVVAIKKQNNQLLQLQLDNGDKLDTEIVLFATGRQPDTENLGLHNAKIKTQQNSQAIIVDQYCRTNIENIFAIGDVIDKIQLTPVAITQGQAIAENLFAKKSNVLDYDNIPTAVFSQPEIGVVGLTEEQANKKFGEVGGVEPGGVDVYLSEFQPLAEHFADVDEKNLIKLIVKRSDQKILGCHMIGKNSAEMIQLVAIAVKMGATKDDFDKTIAVHPTTAEEIVTMKNKKY